MELLRNQRGQTSLEYLMLLGLTFIVGYIVITGPMGAFAEDMVLRVRGGIGNTVRNGEWKNQVAETGTREHAGDEKRFRPEH